VNIHLLVSPEDPNHVAEVKRILTRLQFHAHNDRFDCTRDELIKLGKHTARLVAQFFCAYGTDALFRSRTLRACRRAQFLRNIKCIS
jgi:hypothetical protein